MSIFSPLGSKTGSLLVHDPFGSVQYLQVFANEADAREDFELLAKGPWYKSEYPPSFMPQLENILFGCRLTGDGATSCNVVMQYDRYVTNTGMEIGGGKTTFQDWENFMIAMQARLITYVEEEQQEQ